MRLATALALALAASPVCARDFTPDPEVLRCLAAAGLGQVTVDAVLCDRTQCVPLPSDVASQLNTVVASFAELILSGRSSIEDADTLNRLIAADPDTGLCTVRAEIGFTEALGVFPQETVIFDSRATLCTLLGEEAISPFTPEEVSRVFGICRTIVDLWFTNPDLRSLGAVLDYPAGLPRVPPATEVWALRRVSLFTREFGADTEPTIHSFSYLISTTYRFGALP